MCAIIFAVGDVLGGPQFTHHSNFQGTAAAQNALLPLVKTVGMAHDLLPTVTYTDPEIAHVGLTEEQARERHGRTVKVYVHPMSKSDRGRTEGDTEGFIKIVHRGGRLLGVTIVAARAGEMISEVAVAMKAGLSVRQIVSTMHPYPSYNETLFAALGFMLVDELFDGASGRLINTAMKILY
ncbi:NAD(P)/FAD-dependent oxidoreductase [bacterium]|nr:NAD(P)/FAD-dependent oxidoreductase [bacterium]